MHISGKIFAWLIIPLAIWGLLWTGKLMKIQSSWNQAVLGSDPAQSLAAKNANLADDVRNARDRVRDLRAEFSRTTLDWDRTFENVQVRLNQQGFLQASGMGTETGLTFQPDVNGQTPPLLLYGFYQQPEGYVFAGEFQVNPQSLQTTGCALVPTALFRPTQQNWPNGIWRFRTRIPPQYRTRLNNMERRFVNNNDEMNSKTLNLARQEKLVEMANETRQIRVNELQGDPNAQPNELRPEDSIGLVAAIDQDEEKRNDLQADVDDLRRRIREALIERDRLHDSIVAETERLPQGSGNQVSQRDRAVRP